MKKKEITELAEWVSGVWGREGWVVMGGVGWGCFCLEKKLKSILGIEQTVFLL